MAKTIFLPNTQAQSAQVNDNFDGAYSGAYDYDSNRLLYFRRENIANHIISGMLLAVPSSTLTLSIPAGIALVNGQRVTPVQNTRAYTASKDTYIDLKDDGTYAFVEVANNATAGMTLTLNSDGSKALRIGMVRTSGTVITKTVQQSNISSPSNPTNSGAYDGGQVNGMGNGAVDPIGNQMASMAALQSLLKGLTINVNGVERPILIKTGQLGLAVSVANTDYINVNTGVANFPTACLFGFAWLASVPSSWNILVRGVTSPYNGASNITWDNIHVDSSVAQTVSINWFAVGY